MRIDGVREPRLDLAVADPAGAIALLDGGDRPRVGERTQQRDERAGVGILRLLRRRGVGDDPPDLLAHVVRLRHERDGVAVGLAHLAAVEAGERRGRLGDERARFAQHAGPVAARELLGEVHGDLQVLRLVGADRHLVGVEREDVGGHQHRVAVEAHVHAVVGVASGRDVGGDRRLVGVGAVEQPLGATLSAGRRSGDRGDPALAVQVDVRAVEAAGEQRGGEPPGALAQHRGVGAAVERVQIGDEDVHVPGRVGRELRQRPDRADVVAEVQIPGRLDAGQGDGPAGRGRALGRLGCAVVWVMTVISWGWRPCQRTGAMRDHRGRAVAGPAGVGPELRPVSDEGLKRPAG